MLEIVGNFEIPEAYVNAIYGIDDLGSSEAGLGFEYKVEQRAKTEVDPELQAAVDKEFTMAIYTQPGMVGVYLEGAFGAFPSRRVIENTLATLRTEDPSSNLIEMLIEYLR